MRTEKFIKKYAKIDNSIRLRFDKHLAQLPQNPFIGKPLRTAYFRELKVKNYRLYFVISERDIIVLLLDTSTKKDQEETINTLYPYIRHLFDFKE